MCGLRLSSYFLGRTFSRSTRKSLSRNRAPLNCSRKPNPTRPIDEECKTRSATGGKSWPFNGSAAFKLSSQLANTNISQSRVALFETSEHYSVPERRFSGSSQTARLNECVTVQFAMQSFFVHALHDVKPRSTSLE